MSLDPVCVLVGEWNCTDNGSWDFRMARGRMGKMISLPENGSFECLCEIIAQKLAVDRSEMAMELSFRCPEISNVCSASRVPPVAMTSDLELFQFVRLRELRKDLNLCVTLNRLEKSVGVQYIASVSSPDFNDPTMLALIQSVEDAARRNGPISSVDQGSSFEGRGFPCTLGETGLPDAGWKSLNDAIEEALASPPCAQRTPPPFMSSGGTTSTPYTENGGSSCGNRSSRSENAVEDTPSIIRLLSPSPVTPVPFDLDIDEELVRSSSRVPTFDLGIDDEVLGNASQGPSLVLTDPSSENDRMLEIVDLSDPVYSDPPPNVEYTGVDLCEEVLFVDRVFDTKDDLNMALSIYALERFFLYKIEKSDKHRSIARCADPSCYWRVYVTCVPGSEKYQICTVVLEHTCGVEYRSRYSEKATTKVLATLLQSRYANGKKGPRACDIPDILLAEMKLTVNYMRSWHAKEIAMARARGTEEDNYKMLEAYLVQLQKTNPGTQTAIESTVDRAGKVFFKYLYFAFGASIAGLPHMRKVVVVDATQLKGKYRGCLATASCQDGNMKIFPIAFGILDSENEKSWVWFCQKLKNIICDDSELVFVSDRHPAIHTALTHVFPNSRHCFCIVHLNRTVKHRFRCEGLAAMVSRAARAFTRVDFDHWWAEIETRSPTCAAFLRGVGFENWARYFCHQARYNLMSSNIAESLNATIKKSVDFPIITLIEFIRTLLMRWFAERRLDAKACTSPCTPAVDAILVDYLNNARYFSAIPASETVFQVTDQFGYSNTMDLYCKSCTCLVFDKMKYPCPHALAARKVYDVNIYSLVDDCYKVTELLAGYGETVMPVANLQNLQKGQQTSLQPPHAKRPPGRPPKLRIPSRGEFSNGGSYKPPRCGRCGKAGHNKATCRNPIN